MSNQIAETATVSTETVATPAVPTKAQEWRYECAECGAGTQGFWAEETLPEIGENPSSMQLEDVLEKVWDEKPVCPACLKKKKVTLVFFPDLIARIRRAITQARKREFDERESARKELSAKLTTWQKAPEKVAPGRHALRNQLQPAKGSEKAKARQAAIAARYQ